MARDVMHDFAAAGGVADMDRVLEIEMGRHGCEIIGIMIHVVAVGDLRRTAMAATVMRDDAIAARDEEHHLRVPVVSRQRPAVTEHDRLATSPVLVEDLDAVLGGDGGHC
ncbi:hypothetical protein ACVWZK_001902 [Bradyrhizobium sp. GM0.4]